MGIDELTGARDAESVNGPPVGEHGEEFTYYRVGLTYAGYVDGIWKRELGIVSRITITEDLPGLHRNMERVRVWDNNKVIAEMPLHNMEHVSYI